jgi:hypothetical protein
MALGSLHFSESDVHSIVGFVFFFIQSTLITSQHLRHHHSLQILTPCSMCALTPFTVFHSYFILTLNLIP